MRSLNRIIYFETSAANLFVNKFAGKSGRYLSQLTGNFKNNLGYLSPVTLWEILLTNNEEQRERIIFVCQHLFKDKLLPSPAEIIVDYIEAGCPLYEEKRIFHSNLSMSNTWAELCADKTKTIIISQEELMIRSEIMRNLSRQLNRFVQNNEAAFDYNNTELLMQNTLNGIFDLIKGAPTNDNKELNRALKISILFVLYILCVELDLDNTPYKQYWNKSGLNTVFDRALFIIEKKPKLFTTGPFFEMALMAHHQSTIGGKSNRGLMWDCLHSIYLTYADTFVTNDEHFQTLRRKYNHLNYSKIVYLNDFEKRPQ
jgi:hypothetical protein